MPYPTGHRAETKKKIVDSARRLFNRHGFESVSIAQIMAGASEEEIRASWEPALSEYKKMRVKYILYPDK